MNTQSTRITTFILGATLGGIVGYLIADYAIYMKFQDYMSKVTKVEEETKNDVEESAVEEDLAVNYSGMSAKKGDINKLAVDSIVREENYVPRTIRVGDLSDWVEAINKKGQPGIRHTQIIYYHDDSGVYAIPGEGLIHAPVDILGPNSHLHFGRDSDDPDVVYIINDELGMVYEVVRILESYKETVDIIDPETAEVFSEKVPIESRRHRNPPPPKKVEEGDETSE